MNTSQQTSFDSNELVNTFIRDWWFSYKVGTIPTSREIRYGLRELIKKYDLHISTTMFRQLQSQLELYEWSKYQTYVLEMDTESTETNSYSL